MEKELKELLKSQPLAVLATQKGDQPYTNLVAFNASEDLKFLFFATIRSTRKYANISADPKISMLIDNRSNQISDFRVAMAATATGEAEEVDLCKEKSLLDAYLLKHPDLEEFVTSPTCAFLRVRVKTYVLVTGLQDVTEIHMTS